MDTDEISQSREARLINRIDQLIAIGQRGGGDKAAPGEAYHGAISVASELYGSNSPQLEAIKALGIKPAGQNEALAGMLKNILAEIQAGLVTSLRVEAKGEVLTDLLIMAKQAIKEGTKEIAAVLACAALEDILKNYAEVKGINVDEKDMSNIISILKAKGLIKGPKGKLLASFVSIRNSAFHAKWDKIESPEIQSIIAFVEDFLINEFIGKLLKV